MVALLSAAVTFLLVQSLGLSRHSRPAAAPTGLSLTAFLGFGCSHWCGVAQSCSNATSKHTPSAVSYVPMCPLCHPSCSSASGLPQHVSFEGLQSAVTKRQALSICTYLTCCCAPDMLVPWLQPWHSIPPSTQPSARWTLSWCTSSATQTLSMPTTCASS